MSPRWDRSQQNNIQGPIWAHSKWKVLLFSPAPTHTPIFYPFPTLLFHFRVCRHFLFASQGSFIWFQGLKSHLPDAHSPLALQWDSPSHHSLFIRACWAFQNAIWHFLHQRKQLICKQTLYPQKTALLFITPVPNWKPSAFKCGLVWPKFPHFMDCLSSIPMLSMLSRTPPTRDGHGIPKGIKKHSLYFKVNSHTSVLQMLNKVSIITISQIRKLSLHVLCPQSLAGRVTSSGPWVGLRLSSVAADSQASWETVAAPCCCSTVYLVADNAIRN